MAQKKNILMLCSWLDPETGIGSFFWEQAEIMTPDFNMTLCVFNSYTYGASNFHKFFTHKLVDIQKAPNGLPIIRFNYPEFAHISERLNRFLFKKYIRKFSNYIIKENFEIDLVHAQSLLNAGITAQSLYEVSGIPYVFTEHNQFNYRSIDSERKKNINKIFSNDFDKMVVSYDKIRQLSSNNLFADYIVVGNTINNEIFNYTEITRNEDVFRIITIGAYSLFKDQETLLNSLQLIDNQSLSFQNRKIEFIWLGYNGWGIENTAEVRKLLEKFLFKNISITIIPKVDRLQIKNYLQDSDLFLLTSISEGMPVSVMEALACGVPVCSTRCGGVDELIDETNGKIFQIKDSTAIAEYITDCYLGKYKFNNKKISEQFIDKWGKNKFKSKMTIIYNRMIEKYSKKECYK